jgi:glycine betaine/choline ABC-type transport system substrate-binding protein
MPKAVRYALSRLAPWLVTGLAMVVLAGCGGGSRGTGGSASGTAGSTAVPGAGRPQVTIGDKNFTEQFVLGELYYHALKAQGFPVLLNQNIGPTEVTIRALETGRLGLYPEYIDTWDRAVAGDPSGFRSRVAAYDAGQRWARDHGLELLIPTPFGDTSGVAVTWGYAVHHGLASLGDLQKVAGSLTLGGPPQFRQSAMGLPAIERAYGVIPAVFEPLAIGAQYRALDRGTVQAAAVQSTDGPLITGHYALLGDPEHVFGWGNVVPVVPRQVLAAEGPAFAATINKVSALLSTAAIRQLNAAVDVSGETPEKVAKRFLIAHGLASPSS